MSYIDHHLGIIVNNLKARGLDGRTLLVLTADHGTEFKEHGFLEKKLNLYEEISQVPLILYLPGRLPAGKRLKGLAQTADIPLTILDICSIPVQDDLHGEGGDVSGGQGGDAAGGRNSMDGRSLLPRILGEKDGVPGFVVAHTIHNSVVYRYEHFSIRTASRKLIRTVPLAARPHKTPPGEKWYMNSAERFSRLDRVAELKEGVWRELYDLETDPGETANIITGERKLARELESTLDSWIEARGYTPFESRRKP